MRLTSFEANGRATYGFVANGNVREASDSFRSHYPDLRAVIAAGAYSELEADDGGEEWSADEIVFLPTIPNPRKIICVGVNYRPHAEEMGREQPDYPVLFVRFPESLVGHSQSLTKPRVSERYDYEGEFAVVIGKACRHVRPADAFGVIAGYTCFMDGSVRDWQRHTSQFTAGKNFTGSGAMGPELVTVDEVADLQSLGLRTLVNDEVMQSGRLDELIFGVPELIGYCSTFAELLPGDVIATGTPGGVGVARNPPVFLGPGDRVQVEIDQIGRLDNVVIEE